MSNYFSLACTGQNVHRHCNSSFSLVNVQSSHFNCSSYAHTFLILLMTFNSYPELYVQQLSVRPCHWNNPNLVFYHPSSYFSCELLTQSVNQYGTIHLSPIQIFWKSMMRFTVYQLLRGMSMSIRLDVPRINSTTSTTSSSSLNQTLLPPFC